MKLDSIKSDLYAVKKKAEQNNLNIRIYIYGSIFTKENPNDIDVLIVYETYNDAFTTKNFLSQLENIYPLDCLYLTISEEQEFNFVKQQNAVEIITDSMFT